MKKLIAFIVFLPLLVFFGYNYFVPISYNNSCKDENLFRYQFAIYELDKTSTNNEPKKIAGLKEYFGFAKTKCLDTLEKERYQLIANSLDSVTKTQGWKPLKCGLYINNKKEIGFKNYYTLGEAVITGDAFSTRLNWNDGPTLNSVIDTASFRNLNGAFYKDKNHIYQSYATLGGCALWIFDKADYATFSILNDYYAKDKNHIYDYRNGIIENADVETFKVLDDAPFAKDKNHLYNWDSVIDENFNTEDSTLVQMIKKLKQLK